MTARSPGLAIWSPGAHSCSSFNLLRRHGCLLDRSALHRQPRGEQADPLHWQVHRVRTGGSVLSSLCIWATWNLRRQYSWAGRWKTVGKLAKRRFDGGLHIFSLICLLTFEINLGAILLPLKLGNNFSFFLREQRQIDRSFKREEE